VADGLVVVVPVVEIVVVGELLARCDVAEGNDPDMFFELIRLAVGSQQWLMNAATLSRRPRTRPPEAEEISIGAVGIELVRFLLGEARTGVLDDVGPFRDRDRRVAAGSRGYRTS